MNSWSSFNPLESVESQFQALLAAELGQPDDDDGVSSEMTPRNRAPKNPPAQTARQRSEAQAEQQRAQAHLQRQQPQAQAQRQQPKAQVEQHRPHAQVERQRAPRVNNFNLDSPDVLKAWTQRLNQQANSATPSPTQPSPGINYGSSPTVEHKPVGLSTTATIVQTSNGGENNQAASSGLSRAPTAPFKENSNPTAPVHRHPQSMSLASKSQSDENLVFPRRSNDARQVPTGPRSTTNHQMLQSSHASPAGENASPLPGRIRKGSGPTESLPEILMRINDQLQGVSRRCRSQLAQSSATAATQALRSKTHEENKETVQNAPPAVYVKSSAAIAATDVPKSSGQIDKKTAVQNGLAAVQTTLDMDTATDSQKRRALHKERVKLSNAAMGKLEEVRVMVERLDVLDAQARRESTRDAAWDSPLAKQENSYFTPLVASKTQAEAGHGAPQNMPPIVYGAAGHGGSSSTVSNAPAELTTAYTFVFKNGIFSGGGVENRSKTAHAISQGSNVTPRPSKAVPEPRSLGQDLVQVSPPRVGIWQQERDEFGEIYYFHTGTKEKGFTKPKPWSFAEERASHQPWRIRNDAKGRRCYVNIETGDSVWTMPQALQQALGAQSEQLALNDPSFQEK